MKKALSLILAIILCVSMTVPAFAGSSIKFPEGTSVGQRFTIATSFYRGYAIKNDGSLWMWGNGGVERDSTPEQVMTDVVSVRTTNYTDFALKSDGSVWLMDYTDNGNGTQSQLLTDISAIAGEYDSSFYAIKNDGTLIEWNKDYLGKVTTATLMSDVQLVFPSHEAMMVGDYVPEIISEDAVFIVKADGTLWKLANESVTPVTDNVNEIIAAFQDRGLDDEGNLYKYDIIFDDNGEWNFEFIKIDTGVVAYAYDGYQFSFNLKADGTLWASTNYGRDEFVQILSNVRLPDSGFLFSITSSELGNIISWQPSDNPDGYYIYRSTVVGDEGERITKDPIHGGSFVDVNVESSTTYYYTIKALAKEADGSYTEKVLEIESGALTVKTGEIIDVGEGEKKYILMRLDNPEMLVSGVWQEIDPGRGTAPIIKDNRTLVPIRAIVEAMDGEANWNGDTRTVTLDALGHNVSMQIGSKDITVDGKPGTMDIAPEILNERTLLPLRFAAEELGAKVTWIGSTREIVIVWVVEE